MVLIRSLCFFLLMMSGCAYAALPAAPVVNGWTSSQIVQTDYQVQPGDTVYSIAKKFKITPAQLIQVNQLKSPYTLHTGQRLKLSNNLPPVMMPLSHSAAPAASQKTKKPPKTTPTAAKKTQASAPKKSSMESAPTVQKKSTTATYKPSSASTRVSTKPLTVSKQGWIWPTKGVIVQGYGASGNKGINIAGKMNQPILAAAAGQVVYVGSGLESYGKMIILKNSNNYLSAYAHNNEVFVKEGQVVARGQTIASMGNTGANRIMLHFEIRQGGKPINPLAYLPKQ